jgi:membrane protease YdiL (CAAX protease family)
VNETPSREGWGFFDVLVYPTLKTFNQVGHLGVFFLISFLFSWACWAPGVLSHFGLIQARFSPLSPLQLLGDFGPTVGALAASALERGGLRQLGLAFWRRRLPLRWHAVSLFMPVAIMLSAWTARAAVLHTKLQITLANIGRPGFLQGGFFLTLVAIAFFATGMFIFAAAEEVGWRGFALPRLMSRTGFLAGSRSLGPDMGDVASSPGLCGWQSVTRRKLPAVYGFKGSIVSGIGIHLGTHSKPVFGDCVSRGEQLYFLSPEANPAYRI